MPILEEIEDGLSSPDENTRWQAAIAAGELIYSNPDDVWLLARKYGSSENSDLRSAVATCILEHLLEEHFEDYFPRLENEIRSGNHMLADTFLWCWQLGEAKNQANVAKWQALLDFVSKRD
jgi:hypothetical protein